MGNEIEISYLLRNESVQRDEENPVFFRYCWEFGIFSGFVGDYKELGGEIFERLKNSHVDPIACSVVNIPCEKCGLRDGNVVYKVNDIELRRVRENFEKSVRESERLVYEVGFG